MQDHYFSYIGTYLSRLQDLDRFFQDWGYQPTIVPMVDEYSPYEHLDEARLPHNFRLLNANRELLLLRADSTVFLSRIISTHIRKSILPLRLCYSNSVVRPTNEYNKNELWQSGIELIGVANIAGDFEILLMMSKALEVITNSQYRIHIGSLSIVNHMLFKHNPRFIPVQITEIHQALAERDGTQLALLTSPEIADILLSIMGVDDFFKRRTQINALLPDDSKSLTLYNILIESLAQTVSASCIRCDFSELGSNSYYTNIVFSAYAQGQAMTIAQGGRYDRLLQYFGSDVSAVGATIFPHILISFLLKQDPFSRDDMRVKNSFNSLSEVRYPGIEDLIMCAKKQEREK